MLTKESATDVATCTATNVIESRDMYRCSPRTAKAGRPGSRPCRFTIRPMIMTSDSSTRLTTPVARLAYQSASVEWRMFRWKMLIMSLRW